MTALELYERQREYEERQHQDCLNEGLRAIYDALGAASQPEPKTEPENDERDKEEN